MAPKSISDYLYFNVKLLYSIAMSVKHILQAECFGEIPQYAVWTTCIKSDWGSPIVQIPWTLDQIQKNFFSEAILFHFHDLRDRPFLCTYFKNPNNVRISDDPPTPKSEQQFEKNNMYTRKPF